ncbi:MAG: ferritin [Rhodospirillales bacterium]|nr:ferritin [Rhodospirillales bacterium]
MSSESLHAPRQRLTIHTLTHHQAIASLMEELEAVDWYKQRADDCEDAALKDILLHNMREEMEHACMVMEWLRRSDSDWAEQMSTYLFTEAPITEVEEAETGGNGPVGGGDAQDEAAPEKGRASPPAGFTIGTLKDNGE